MYMVWPDAHGMVYGMPLSAWHGIWYGLAGMACHIYMSYMVWYIWFGLASMLWYGLASIIWCRV